MNRSYIPSVLGLWATFTCMFVADACADVILLSVNVVARNTEGNDSYTETSIPASGTLTVVDFPDLPPRPVRSSTVEYSLSQSSGVAEFRYDYSGSFAHDFYVGNIILGTGSSMQLGGMIGGSIPMMSFSVDRISSYEIDGNFAAGFTGLFPSQLSSISYDVELLEFTDGVFGPPPKVLFRHNLSESLNGRSGTFDRTVTVGQNAGVPNEILIGSIFGTLKPGNVYGYNLTYSAGTRNETGPSGIIGATSGSFALKVTATPEPASVTLSLLATGAVCFRKIRNKRKHVS